MSKRKLNLQQQKRIQHQHSQWLVSDDEQTRTGLVICSFGKRAELETPEGERMICMIRPNLPTLVAGDRVIWKTSHQAGVILSHFTRETVLERQDKQGKSKPLAANLTQLIIVLAPQPAPTWSLIDSYLMVAEHMGLKACLVLNKVDLPSQENKEILETHYAPLGYPIVYSTVYDSSSLQALQANLQHQVSIFIGQSGVGKSSLITALLPANVAIETAPLSNVHGLGKHTTTHTRYYHLPEGGDLMDSPGVRAFTPPFFDAQHLVSGYREFRPFLGQCQFRNCDHRQTPGCAIIAAVNQQKISAFRYQNFLNLLP